MVERWGAQEGVGFEVGQSVRFRRDVKDSLMMNVRAREGDEGEIVHVLPKLDPPAVVVKLDNPRIQGTSRVIVQLELVELALPISLTDVIARKASMAAHPSSQKASGTGSLPVAGPAGAPVHSELAPVIPIGRKHAEGLRGRVRARA
jgi:hypothetical protein